MTHPIAGRCLCGAVTVEVAEFDGHVGACHCGMCRRWGGGPSLSLRADTLRLGGDASVRIHRASDWAERGFCGDCGTHLFYRLDKTGSHFVWAGLFDELPGARLDHQIFIDRKPGWYEFANPTENLTEAEVFAKFAGG